MIQKESYGFNTYAAVRVGKIQEVTAPSDWYWVEGHMNTVDWTTRGGEATRLIRTQLMAARAKIPST